MARHIAKLASKYLSDLVINTEKSRPQNLIMAKGKVLARHIAKLANWQANICPISRKPDLKT